MARNPSSGEWRGGPVMVGDVVLHSDIITEFFACHIAQCGGACCHEGDAGAPVTPQEIADIEDQLDELWPRLTAGAQSEIDHHGVAYADPEGDLVTSIVRGGDCCFRGPEGCLLRQRPISCHLYPIREKRCGAVTALNYHRWNICEAARLHGRQRNTRVYQFLREPLVRRFGAEWYAELDLTARELIKQFGVDE